jgi:cytochrome c5
MANDEFDNARADKAVLEEMNAKFAAERAKREADDPRKRIADTVCPACKGSGLDPKLTRFEWDEFNPGGFWETEPCEVCHGSALSPGVENAIENGVYAERDRDEARGLLRKAVEGLTKALETVKGIPSAKKEPKAVDRALGVLEDELTELLQELDPEPTEGTDQ